MNNLYLVGFMGSGKSTIGKDLAYKLNRELIDMDYTIEQQTGRSIRDIFETDGEETFRQLETQLIESLSEQENKVVATGGGIVMNDINIAAMKSGGKVIFLHANEEQLFKFLKNDQKRPLLQGDNYEDKIRTLLAQRETYYLNSADMIIQCTNKNIQEIANEILNLL
jgi:shikimate kinase